MGCFEKFGNFENGGREISCEINLVLNEARVSGATLPRINANKCTVPRLRAAGKPIVWVACGFRYCATLYLPTLSEPKARDFYPADCRSFRICSDYFQRFPENSQDVPKNSEVSRCVWDRLKKNNSPGGLKHDLQGLFRSQIKPSLHFSVVNGSFKAY